MPYNNCHIPPPKRIFFGLVFDESIRGLMPELFRWQQLHFVCFIRIVPSCSFPYFLVSFAAHRMLVMSWSNHVHGLAWPAASSFPLHRLDLLTSNLKLAPFLSCMSCCFVLYMFSKYILIPQLLLCVLVFAVIGFLKFRSSFPRWAAALIPLRLCSYKISFSFFSPLLIMQGSFLLCSGHQFYSIGNLLV